MSPETAVASHGSLPQRRKVPKLERSRHLSAHRLREREGVAQNPDGHASKGDEKHERTVQRRVCGFGQRTNCGWVHSPPGMAAAYEPTPKGALALHPDRPLGERQMRHGGLIPTRASSQRPSLWHRRGRPLRGQACGSHSPRTPCVRVLRLHPVGGLSMERLIRSML